MSLVRWMITFLAFPLGGVITAAVFGPARDPLAGLAAGLIIGTLVGGAQWLALGRRAGWRWFAGTALAISVGTSLDILISFVIAPLGSVIAGAALTGILVGIIQGFLLRHRGRTTGIWAAVTAAAWAIGAAISTLAVEGDRGFAAFGTLGALVATAITGIVLRMLLGSRGRPVTRDPDSGPMLDVAASLITATRSAASREQ
ncbi:hypothetical protein [Microbacterium rhizomatis]|uniref:Uncharacterized protein n=1 Tax=Microbacterium rhizomatis TaxID=1631477 RepID=A0A5J5J2L3_9MICO|nr:hypothetical protein [Microbacterium rhizomatis]KAA9110300.1 hypothetical protein F6B43_00950 [Microbacterium rhizomatis]